MVTRVVREVVTKALDDRERVLAVKEYEYPVIDSAKKQEAFAHLDIKVRPGEL